MRLHQLASNDLPAVRRLAAEDPLYIGDVIGRPLYWDGDLLCASLNQFDSIHCG